MRFKALAILGLGSLALVGCGGGSGSGVSATPSSQSFGTVSAQVVLTQEPVVIRGFSSTVYGLVGTISDAVYNNQDPTLDDTQLVVQDGNTLRMIDYSGRTVQTVSPPGMDILPINEVSIDRAGNIYYCSNNGTVLNRYNTLTRTNTLMRSGLTRGASVNPSATKCLFFDGVSGKYKLSALNGTGETIYGLSSSYDFARFAGDNAIAAHHSIENTVYFNDLAGANFRHLVGLGGSGFHDSSRFFLLDGSGNTVMLGQRGSNSLILPGLNNCVWVSPCPTGEAVAGLLVDGSVRSVNIQDGSSNTVEFNEIGTSVTWGYLPRNLRLVGIGSTFSTTAAGMAMGMQHGVPRSYVVWDAQTRTTSQLRADSGNVTNDTLVMTAEADKITSFKYSNDRRGFGINISLGTAVTTVVMTFNDSTGKVESVIPISVSRGQGKPQVSRTGSSVEIEGDIVGAYDAEGRNLAPSGARRVVVEKGKISVG